MQMEKQVAFARGQKQRFQHVPLRDFCHGLLQVLFFSLGARRKTSTETHRLSKATFSVSEQATEAPFWHLRLTPY